MVTRSPRSALSRQNGLTAPRGRSAQTQRRAAHLAIQRAMADPGSLTGQDVHTLQRTVGNRATAHLLAPVIQAQSMTLGPADDAYEREADHAAAQVMRRVSGDGRLLDESGGGMPVAVQRRLRAGQPSLNRSQLHRRPPSHGPEGGDVAPDVSRQIQSAQGKGNPLHEPVRRRMEQGFGTDFSNVRVHTDQRADTLNRSLNANAFTTGQDLFFRKGAYDPTSQSGQRLIAHELTHTIQQSGGVQRTFQLQRDLLIQRDDDEKGVVGNAVDLGDIGGALVEIYESVNGDESASTIIKAITELSGGIADTMGGGGDFVEGSIQDITEGSDMTTAKGWGNTSRITGGATQVVAKGSGLMSTLMDYGQSAMSWVSSWGYGSSYTDKVGDACKWLGGWAKSTSDLVRPYAYWTDLVSSGSKAVTGVTDGWQLGYVMQDLDKLVKSAGDAKTKEAAKLLFDVVWWKRLDSYAKGGVGAIEGASTVYLGPLSKGISTVLTKSYESGWASYLLRAIGSSITSSVWSNAQLKQQMELDKTKLMDAVEPMVANSKIKDILELCRCAKLLGMKELVTAILTAFNNPPSGKASRYQARKSALEQQATTAGIVL